MFTEKREEQSLDRILKTGEVLGSLGITDLRSVSYQLAAPPGARLAW